MRRWVVLGAVLAALAAAAPSAAASWSTPVDMSTKLAGFYQDDPDESPSLAVNARGDAVAVWLRKRQGFTDCCTANRLMASHRPAGGRFSAPRPISALGDDPSSPVATIDEAGNATVAWTVNELEGDLEHTRPKIGYADLPAGAARFGPVRTLRSGGWGAKWPRLLTVPGGETVILWTESVKGDILDRQARARAASRSGLGDFGEPQVLSESSTYLYGAVVGPGGHVLLPSVRTEGDTTAVELSSRPPGGRFADRRRIAEANGKRRLFGAGLSVDGERGVLVRWGREGEARESSTVEAMYLGADGRLGPQEDLPYADAKRATLPTVAFHPDGTAVAAWTVGGMLHRSTRPPGGTFGPAEAAGPPAGEPVPWPHGLTRLIPLPDGSMLATWNRSFAESCSRYGCHPSDYAMESARLPRSGGFEPYGRISPLDSEPADVERFGDGALALWSTYGRGPQIATFDATLDGPPATSRRAPRIEGFSLVGCGGPKHHRRCTRSDRPVLTFALSEPGSVAVRLAECPEDLECRSIRVLRASGMRGRNRMPIPRRMVAAMRRGRYEANAVAENAAGNDSRRLARLRFTLAGTP